MARPRSDIAPRIVRAARAKFLNDGVDGASLREIARDAGTNLGMIVYYYPTKDDLFLAVVEEVYAKLMGDIELVLSGAGTIRERLHRAFVRLGTVADDELSVMRLVAREALVSSNRFRQILERSRRGHLRALLAALTGAVADGEIDAALPPTLLLVCTMALGGAPQMLRRAAGDEPPFSLLPDPEQLAALSVELLFRAVGTRNTTPAATKPKAARSQRPSKKPTRTKRATKP
jgi:AcrR family transcriptional regulator